MKTLLEKARVLRDLVEDVGLHGLYFQHVSLCRRRAWLHLCGATHAVYHARVARGLALHQTEKRPGGVPYGLGIMPDAIDFENRVVTEKKGGKGAQDAVAKQALFYAAYMTAATGEQWRAEVQFYGSRQKISLDLTDEALDQLIQDAISARALLKNPAPRARRIPLCASCSCEPVCWDEE